MRLALLIPLFAALAFAAQYQLLVGPNSTMQVSFNGSAFVVNNTIYRVPNVPYEVLTLPTSGRYYLAVIGASFPASCSLTTAPDGFYISCTENQPIVVTYVVSPGYSIACDQQPQTRQSQGPVGILQFNVLRLNCRLVRGVAGATLSPYVGATTALLGALTIALGITIAGLLLVGIFKQRGEGASSR